MTDSNQPKRYTWHAVAGALIATLILVVWHGVFPDTDPHRPGETTELAGDALRTEPAASATERSTSAVLQGESEQPRDPAPRSDTAVELASPAAGCRVFGLVLDQDDQPVAGARVLLFPVDARWSQVVELPRKLVGGREREVVEGATDERGRFVLETVAPSAAMATIAIEPSVYYSRAARQFGQRGPQPRPSLTAGDNDAGTVRLAHCGAITGVVRSSNGQPLEKAGVRATPQPASTRERGTPPTEGVSRLGPLAAQWGSDGRFTLGHLLPGARAVGADAKGMLSSEPISVDVRAGVTLDVGVITLEPAFTIRGIVVDEAGAPVPHARIQATTLDRRSLVSEITGDDGRFQLHCDVDQPHGLRLSGNLGFEDWGAQDLPEARVAPGPDEVRIVLRRIAQTTFRVLDAASRVPIERYGLDVRPIPSSGDRRVSAGGMGLKFHTRGEFSWPAVPGKHFVCAWAPGYAPLEVDVQHDDPSQSLQTLLLHPEAALTGRVVLDGVPQPGAKLVLNREQYDARGAVVAQPDPDSSTTRIETGPDGRARVAPAHTYDVKSFAGRSQSLTADEQGRFRFGGLAGGHYNLHVQVPDVTRCFLRELLVPPVGERDLGDVELPHGAAIVGRFVLPAGEDLAGYTVLLDGTASDRAILTHGAEGFRFVGLTPGPYRVTWRRAGEDTRQRPVDDPRKRELLLAPGETREVVFDAAVSAPATVAVRVLRAGVPVAGVTVLADLSVDSGRSGAIAGPAKHVRLGRTDAEGRVEGRVEGGARFELLALLENRRTCSFTETEELLSPVGGRIERTRELCTGQLTIELGPEIVRPARGHATLRFDSGPAGVQTIHAATYGVVSGEIHWSGPSLDLGELGCGNYQAALEIVDSAAPDAAEREHPLSIVIRAGERTVVKVP